MSAADVMLCRLNEIAERQERLEAKIDALAAGFDALVCALTDEDGDAQLARMMTLDGEAFGGERSGEEEL